MREEIPCHIPCDMKARKPGKIYHKQIFFHDMKTSKPERNAISLILSVVFCTWHGNETITYHTMLSVAYSNQKFCSLSIATETHKSILLGIKRVCFCVVKNTKSGSGLGPSATGIQTSVLRNCVGLPGGCV